MRTPPLNTSDVEWNDEDLLIEINDNITVHQTPAASSTPVPVLNESEMLSPPESPGVRSHASENRWL